MNFQTTLDLPPPYGALPNLGANFIGATQQQPLPPTYAQHPMLSAQHIGIGHPMLSTPSTGIGHPMLQQAQQHPMLSAQNVGQAHSQHIGIAHPMLLAQHVGQPHAQQPMFSALQHVQQLPMLSAQHIGRSHAQQQPMFSALQQLQAQQQTVLPAQHQLVFPAQQQSVRPAQQQVGQQFMHAQHLIQNTNQAQQHPTTMSPADQLASLLPSPASGTALPLLHSANTPSASRPMPSASAYSNPMAPKKDAREQMHVSFKAVRTLAEASISLASASVSSIAPSKRSKKSRAHCSYVFSELLCINMSRDEADLSVSDVLGFARACMLEHNLPAESLTSAPRSVDDFVSTMMNVSRKFVVVEDTLKGLLKSKASLTQKQFVEKAHAVRDGYLALLEFQFKASKYFLKNHQEDMSVEVRIRFFFLLKKLDSFHRSKVAIRTDTPEAKEALAILSSMSHSLFDAARTHALSHSKSHSKSHSSSTSSSSSSSSSQILPAKEATESKGQNSSKGLRPRSSYQTLIGALPDVKSSAQKAPQAPVVGSLFALPSRSQTPVVGTLDLHAPPSRSQTPVSVVGSKTPIIDSDENAAEKPSFPLRGSPEHVLISSCVEPEPVPKVASSSNSSITTTPTSKLQKVEAPPSSPLPPASPKNADTESDPHNTHDGASKTTSAKPKHLSPLKSTEKPAPELTFRLPKPILREPAFRLPKPVCLSNRKRARSHSPARQRRNKKAKRPLLPPAPAPAPLSPSRAQKSRKRGRLSVSEPRELTRELRKKRARTTRFVDADGFSGSSSSPSSSSSSSPSSSSSLRRIQRKRKQPIRYMANEQPASSCGDAAASPEDLWRKEMTDDVKYVIENVYSHPLKKPRYNPENAQRCLPHTDRTNIYSTKRVICSPSRPCSFGTCTKMTEAYECDPKRCGAGEACENRRFQKRVWTREKKIEIIRDGPKGCGVRAVEVIHKGELVVEYLGEVITDKVRRRRLEELLRRKDNGENDVHHYFFSLRPTHEDGTLERLTNDRKFIDAARYGNLSRYINHSCEPNCYAETWMVQGEARVGIFASRRIAPQEELSFNYDWNGDERMQTPCLCGSDKCRGVLGGGYANKKKKK